MARPPSRYCASTKTASICCLPIFPCPERPGTNSARAAEAQRPGIKVIWMSGASGRNGLGVRVCETEACLAGKPFSPQMLAAEVRKALGLRRAILVVDSRRRGPGLTCATVAEQRLPRHGSRQSESRQGYPEWASHRSPYRRYRAVRTRRVGKACATCAASIPPPRYSP